MKRSPSLRKWTIRHTYLHQFYVYQQTSWILLLPVQVWLSLDTRKLFRTIQTTLCTKILYSTQKTRSYKNIYFNIKDSTQHNTKNIWFGTKDSIPHKKYLIRHKRHDSTQTIFFPTQTTWFDTKTSFLYLIRLGTNLSGEKQFPAVLTSTIGPTSKFW